MTVKFSLNDKPLYYVTDHNYTNGRAQINIIKAALKGGVRLIQYRDKILSDIEFENVAKEILKECNLHGATLLLNDRVHIAKNISAHGVHLGQGDMHPEEARYKLGPLAIIGFSTHNREEVLDANQFSVDYINIGPIFPTNTKDHSAYPALGLKQVLELSKLSRHPFTTMGGIKKEHLQDFFLQGIQTVAMVTEISLAPDPEFTTQELLSVIRGTPKKKKASG